MTITLTEAEIGIVGAAISNHVKVDATGLAPAVAWVCVARYQRAAAWAAVNTINGILAERAATSPSAPAPSTPPREPA